MIKAIISSYTSSNLKKTNAENNKEVSFKRNDGMSQQSNDEFIKNVEKERDSVISWANKRIDKLNAILEIAKNDDELPKTDKAKIAAAEFHTDRAAKVLKEMEDKGIYLKDIINQGPSTAGGFSGGQKNILNNRVNSASNLSDAQKKDFHDQINRSYYDDNQQQSFGQGDIDTDPYTPDPDSTDVPDTDGDSCDGSDSDCGDSDCDFDTADCFS